MNLPPYLILFQILSIPTSERIGAYYNALVRSLNSRGLIFDHELMIQLYIVVRNNRRLGLFFSFIGFYSVIYASLVLHYPTLDLSNRCRLLNKHSLWDFFQEIDKCTL